MIEVKADSGPSTADLNLVPLALAVGLMRLGPDFSAPC